MKEGENLYSIVYKVNPPTKYFAVNELEEFFRCLSLSLTEQENSRIRLFRMSNGTLSMEYKGCPLGKIKLQGRKHSMQILKSLFDNESIEGNVEDFIQHIPEWIKYLRKHLK